MNIEKVVLDNFAVDKGQDAANRDVRGTFLLRDIEGFDQQGAELEKDASEQAEKLVKVETQDVHNTMISVQKADLSFRMMMQIRNKIIDAYQK